MRPAIDTGIFLIVFVIALTAGSWILAPLDVAAKNRRARIQFTVIDFLGLVFLFQLPMALLRWIAPYESVDDFDATAVWMLYVLGWVASALVWGKSVTVFSQAGIVRAPQRGLLVFFVLPIAFLGTFAAGIVPIVVCFVSMEAYLRGLLVLLEIGLLAGVVVAGHLSHRIARGAMSLVQKKVGSGQ